METLALGSISPQARQNAVKYEAQSKLKETLAPTSMNPQARQITKRTIPETKQNQAKPHGRCPSYKTSEISKDVLYVSTYYESTTVIARTLREIKIACAISSLLTVCSQIHPRFPRKSSQKASRNRRISSKCTLERPKSHWRP